MNDPHAQSSQSAEIEGSALFSVYVQIQAASIDDLQARKERIMREVAEYVLERWDVIGCDVESLR